MRGWGSVAQGTGEGQAHGVSLLIVELVAVVPGAKLVNARERTIAARLSRRGRAIGVLQFRERIGGAAARQIYCWNAWPAGHRAKEEGVRGWRDGEFLVEALFADLDVEFVAEFLLIPELPKSDADGRLDVRQGLQNQEIGRTEIAAPILEAAHVQCAALEAECLFGIHLQGHGGEAVRFKPLFDAATDIAEGLDVLEYGELDAVFGQGGPQPPHVAKQVLILPVAAEHPPWLRRFGCAGRRRRIRTELRRGELRQGERGGIRQARGVRRCSLGASLPLLRWLRRRDCRRDRGGEGGACGAGHRQSGGAPERAPAAAAGWTRAGSQTQTPTHLASGNRLGFPPCERRDVNDLIAGLGRFQNFRMTVGSVMFSERAASWKA